jgi:SAM-dependent methyltransferase
MKRSSLIALSETIAFVRGNAPPPPARLLEIGCGDGRLAARAQDLGYEVVAVDASEESVEAARRLGVDARLASWPEFDDTPFDLLLFARSLHHLSPLDAAVARARDLLRPGGLVLVEDFAWTEIDAPSAEWLHQVLGILEAANLLAPEHDRLARSFLGGPDALQSWREHHEHEPPLHPAGAMLACLERHFGSVRAEPVPYLYRYPAEALPEGPAGDRLARRLLELETRLARIGQITLIGRRYVARP